VFSAHPLRQITKGALGGWAQERAQTLAKKRQKTPEGQRVIVEMVFPKASSHAGTSPGLPGLTLDPTSEVASYMTDTET